MARPKYRTIVLDGDYLAHRSHAINGDAGWAIRKVCELRLTRYAEILYVAWDGESNFRKEVDPRYKANRKPKHDDYLATLDTVTGALSCIGVTQVTCENGEGDDIMATIGRSGIGRTLLWTADKDMLQLVCESIHVLKHINGGEDLITHENMHEYVLNYHGTEVSGLDPLKFINLQALAGDSCDGVSGVPGIGPVRAMKMLAEHPNIVQSVLFGEKLITTGEGDFSAVEKVAAAAEQLAQSARLVTLIPVELQFIEPMATGDPGFGNDILRRVGIDPDHWWLQ